MHTPDLDKLLTNIIESHPSIFDIVFIVGRPLQAEIEGELQAVSGMRRSANSRPSTRSRSR